MNIIEKNQQQFGDATFISSEVKDYLLKASTWGKFLAIVGYLGIGLLILITLFFVFGSSLLSQYSPVGFPMRWMGLLYLILAAVYYFPISYLHKFSIEMMSGLNTNDERSITNGFKNLKSLFKFMGVFTIIVLSIYALTLFTFIVGMVVSAI